MCIRDSISTASPDMEAFFCINDPSALGAAAAIKAANKTGKIGVYSICLLYTSRRSVCDFFGTNYRRIFIGHR